MGSTRASGQVLRKKSLALAAWVAPSFDAAETGPCEKRRRAAGRSSLPCDLLAHKWQPRSRAELCVHVKKVAEVADWLRGALAAVGGARRRPDQLLLLMTGPPGSGKTATVRVLAEELGARLCEWAAPLGAPELPSLEDFLFRADRYAAPGGAGPRLLLLEELPPSLHDDPVLLRRLLERHAAAGRCPLLLLLSDAQHRLLPKAAQEALGAAVIRFNPVAPTQLTKALQRVLRGEAGRARSSKIRNDEVASIVAECGGDIRCALNQLHFLLAKAPGPGGKEGGGRDTNLSIFRALGKVLHCKRLPANPAMPKVRPSLAFDPEEVISNSRLPGSLFAAFLHENSPDFFDSIAEFSEASDAFALADRLAACWREGRSPGQQLSDLYVGPIAARGLTFAKRTPKSVGFRPLRRPELLSLRWAGAGVESRAEVLDLRPFRRAMGGSGSRFGRLARSRFSRAFTEHDSAFEESSRQTAVPPAPKEEDPVWSIPEENEDQVTIEDCD